MAWPCCHLFGGYPFPEHARYVVYNVPLPARHSDALPLFWCLPCRRYILIPYWDVRCLPLQPLLAYDCPVTLPTYTAWIQPVRLEFRCRFVF